VTLLQRERVPWHDCRTLDDDARDGKAIYPEQTEPHVHFHEHGLGRHSHVHVHPDEHAHSTRTDTGRHGE
jgi:hypothetical protein